MRRGFTLIELIVVIIIVGILAAVGISQYSLTVEKSRVAEARVRIGTVSKVAYQYYLENGTFVGLSDVDLGIGSSCSSTSYYSYTTTGEVGASYADVYAYRCASGGKSPQGAQYSLLWRLNASGELSQYAYRNFGSSWVYSSEWGGCCR